MSDFNTPRAAQTPRLTPARAVPEFLKLDRACAAATLSALMDRLEWREFPLRAEFEAALATLGIGVDTLRQEGT
jgi:hypothetical protein